ncbi:hypothetical protein V8B97DRAFT_1999172 [Scleroderma yunnanense]
MVFTKKSSTGADEENRRAVRAQRELKAFGEVYTPKDGRLTKSEIWWSQHYEWFKGHGYLLRPRYAPGWVPSWQGTMKNRFKCEDGRGSERGAILDGTRLSDGAYVTFKIVSNSDHPYEVEIGRFLSSEQLRRDPTNHCIPIYDVLSVPDDQDKVIIVMPLLREYTSPPFDTVGEAIECFRQLFEGLQFMHRNRVAHRDCMSLNIMMDASLLFVDPFHPIHPFMKRDFSGYARFKTRTEQPVKYYFIDFGLSRRYDHSVTHPLEVPIWGGDKEVPEFQNSNEPRDPFATDVFYIGNTIRKDFIDSKDDFEFMRPLIVDMVQADPSKRPPMDEVVMRFETIRKGLSTAKLRSRVARKRETIAEATYLTVLHWSHRLKYVARRLPPVPLPPLNRQN